MAYHKGIPGALYPIVCENPPQAAGWVMGQIPSVGAIEHSIPGNRIRLGARFRFPSMPLTVV